MRSVVQVHSGLPTLLILGSSKRCVTHVLAHTALLALKYPAAKRVGQTDDDGIFLYGAIAQLGERLPCTQEVSGSIPLSSTILKVIQSILATVCCE